MKSIITTNSNTGIAIMRIFLGVVLFPHGAQKLLGWFGGYGFEGTMGFLTNSAGLPYAVALLVILIEFFGALMLIFGGGARVAALGVVALFTGILFTSHSGQGFFMNWSGTQKGEGFEYHLLIIGMAIAVLINGAGRWSVDRMITNAPATEKAGQKNYSVPA
ncbi:MAG: DoxX family protein [Bacteroidota bacterium]